MRSNMRLLPLFLTCLMAGQALAGRVLLQAPWDPTRRQFLQVAVTLQGTCAQTDAARLVRNGVEAGVVAHFNSINQANVADSVKGRLNTDCQDMKDTDGSNLAGFLTSASWVGPDSTESRQILFRAASRDACTGGISKSVFSSLVNSLSAAGFTVKYNQASVQNPNNAKGWIPAVNADNCGGAPTPSPTPSPPTPSPSPSPAPAQTCASFTCAVGSRPNPANVNSTLSGDSAQDQTTCCQPFFDCSGIANSVYDPASNSCQCSAAGFSIAAYDGADLKACLANTITACPAGFTTSVRNTNNGIVSCQTPSTACPEAFNFPLYGGSPATLVECRSASAGCTFTGFNVPIKNNDGMVIGCAASVNGACPAPFVGFRAYDINNYALQECRNVTACPVLEASGNKAYTVRGVDVAGNLRNCLTINFADNQCPSDTPVEVYFSSPLNCGSANLDCNIETNPVSTYSRTVECRPVAAGCPASQSLMLFDYVNNLPINATIVECRQPRAACDLELTTPAPNAGNFKIPIKSAAGDQLLGCLEEDVEQCPALFPTPTLDASGALKECRPRADISCAAGQIPGVDATGATVACFAAGTACGASPAAAFPVSVRSPAGGVERCLAAGSTCPSDRPFPHYGNLQSNAGQVPILRECWVRPATPACVTTGYTKPIKTGETADTLVGCLSDAAITTQCPATAGFGLAYRNSAGVVQECRPSTQTTCPATGSYSTPGRDGNALIACLTASNQCPPNFPVFVRATLTSAIIQCSTPNDCPAGFPFSLRDGSTLQGCLGPQTGSIDCTQFNGYNGPATVDASGAWVGCATDGTSTCPAGSIGYNAVSDTGVSSLLQCRAALPAGATCRTSLIDDFSVNIRNEANAIVACASLDEAVCPTSNPVFVSKSLSDSDPITDCLSKDITACPAITPVAGNKPYSFPLYGGFRVQPSVNPASLGQPAIQGCIAKPSVASCDDNSLDGFTASVYATEFENQLVGCIAETGSVCPASQPFAFLASDRTITACRPAFTSCKSPSQPNNYIVPGYTVELRNAADELQGCTNAVDSCFDTTAGAAYNYQLTMYGPTAALSDGIPVVKQCRTWPLQNGAQTAPADCSSFSNFPVEQYEGGDLADTAAVVGCIAPQTSCPGDDGFPLLDITGGSIQQCRTTKPDSNACTGNWNIPVAYTDESSTAITADNLKACLRTGAQPKACQAIKVVNNFPLQEGNGDYALFVQEIAASQTPTSVGTLLSCRPSSASCAGNYSLKLTLNGASASANNELVGCVGISTGNNAVTAAMCNAWATLYVNNPPVTCWA